MKPQYTVRNAAELLSPSLLFFKELIQENIQRIIQRTGGTGRLRPHVKTHKTREISRLMMDAGIDKFKCATIAEAEMLAMVGAKDILLAYPLVGPNMGRMSQLLAKYPGSKFSALVDHPLPARQLSDLLVSKGQKLTLYLDLNVGQNRTGIVPGPDAQQLYETIHRLPGLVAGGLHVYDGHNHQENPADRGQAVGKLMNEVLALRKTLEAQGIPVPAVVVGGTPTFPVFAPMELQGIECSPGTCVIHDHGYGSRFSDLGEFEPAALVLSRVISRPKPDLVTLDLGYKAIASDPPAGKRCILLNVPDAEPILQNEEHFVVRTPAAEEFQPGDLVYALPTHICPTSAMHKFAYVVEGGKVVGTWEIIARDRILTV